ncbi:response regulator with CheY-like receiver, AAA-type ATPase, and DNA-binding domains [Bradyrhizobium sp. YR681]|nr:response regulator with CheY-like receiver, AAA-type ATPase, and DNA-binding domains [Bradyrhizobium sp. YR681]
MLGYAGAKVSNLSKHSDVILIVEDDFLIRMNAADIVRDMGFDVLEAADADEAVKLLETVPEITVVFTDIQMPGSMDGLRLAEVIRHRWPPVLLLITSGLLSPADNDIPRGARFMAKPYLPTQLQDQLEMLADARA